MSARLTWKEVWSPLVGLVGAFLVALVIAIYIMQAPPGDLRDLLVFLLTSSIPSLLLGYLVFIIGRKWQRMWECPDSQEVGLEAAIL